MYAYFDIQDGALETAFDHAKRALDIARLAGATTPWVAAALYYLGRYLSETRKETRIHVRKDRTVFKPSNLTESPRTRVFWCTIY